MQKEEENSTLKRKKNDNQEELLLLLKKQTNVQYWLPKEIWFQIFDKLSFYYAFLCKTLSKEWEIMMAEYLISIAKIIPYEIFKENFFRLVDDFLQRSDFKHLNICFTFQNINVFEMAAKFDCLNILKYYHENPTFFTLTNNCRYLLSHTNTGNKLLLNDIFNKETTENAIIYHKENCFNSCLKYLFSNQVSPNLKYGKMKDYYSCLRLAIEIRSLESLKIMIESYLELHSLSSNERFDLVCFAYDHSSHIRSYLKETFKKYS